MGGSLPHLDSGSVLPKQGEGAGPSAPTCAYCILSVLWYPLTFLSKSLCSATGCICIVLLLQLGPGPPFCDHIPEMHACSFSHVSCGQRGPRILEEVVCVPAGGKALLRAAQRVPRGPRYTPPHPGCLPWGWERIPAASVGSPHFPVLPQHCSPGINF